MANRSQIFRVCRRTAQVLALAPWHFIALQVPEGLFDLIEKLLASFSESHPVFTLALVFPLLWLLSALSISLTFASILRLQQGDSMSLKDSFSEVWTKLRQIIPASFLVGIAVLCGLLLLIPGIYFMTIYLFVPQIVMTRSTYPATTYLSLSKRLVLTHLKTTLFIVVAIFVLDFAIYALGETLGTWIGGLAAGSAAQNVILIMTKIFLSLIASAAINVGVSFYFLEVDPLQEHRNQ